MRVMWTKEDDKQYRKLVKEGKNFNEIQKIMGSKLKEHPRKFKNNNGKLYIHNFKMIMEFKIGQKIKTLLVPDIKKVELYLKYFKNYTTNESIIDYIDELWQSDVLHVHQVDLYTDLYSENKKQLKNQLRIKKLENILNNSF